MSEDEKGERETSKAKRRLGRYWFAIFVVAPTVIVGGLAWRAILLHLRPADAQIAAIYAARAIPESKNAGFAYCKLAENRLLLPTNPPVADEQALSLTAQSPWLRRDYPKLASWLDERRDLVSNLLNISRMEKCWLPNPSNTVKTDSDLVSQMEGWIHLLRRSANNDVAEGRINVAIDKYKCILRMGDHLCQQPHFHYYTNGLVKELFGLTALIQFITDNDLTNDQLAAIEAALSPAQNRWKQDSKILVKVHRLLERREQPGLTNWFSYWRYRKFRSRRGNNILEHTHKLYLHALARRRILYIRIALRRYKNETGHWPQSLDLIEPSLPKEALTSPGSSEPLVYEPTGESFTLHSKEAD